MNNKNCINLKPNDYFSTAMLIFLALGLDVAVVVIINLFIKTDVNYKHILCNSLTAILWTISLILIHKYIIRNKLTNIITNIKTKQITIKFLFLLVGLIALNLLVKGNGIPQFIEEYEKSKLTYGNIGSITYIVQFIYYLLESALMIYIIVFGQKWGEELFSTKLIPYGGIMLSLTWGLIHILTKDIQTGVIAMVVAIILGIGFNLFKKNYILTWILGLVIFLV